MNCAYGAQCTQKSKIEVKLIKISSDNSEGNVAMHQWFTPSLLLFIIILHYLPQGLSSC